MAPYTKVHSTCCDRHTMVYTRSLDKPPTGVTQRIRRVGRKSVRQQALREIKISLAD